MWHLTFQNFSYPISEPKPDSVTWMSLSLRATRSAMMELWPRAMLPKGPACTSTGWPSMVWIRLGLLASSSQAIMAPSTSRSAVVTGLPARSKASTTRDRRLRRSGRSRARDMMDMISEAAVMSKRERIMKPSLRRPSPSMPMMTLRRA